MSDTTPGIWQDMPQPEPDWDALRDRLAGMTGAGRQEAVRCYCLARYGPHDTPAPREQPDPDVA